MEADDRLQLSPERVRGVIPGSRQISAMTAPMGWRRKAAAVDTIGSQQAQ
jgi:hypothetical protein